MTIDPDDLILVSVDDHVVEPPDLFDGRLRPDHADRAPRIVGKDNGTEMWSFEGQELPNIGLNAVVGRPPAEYGVDPTSFAQMRPGCYDIDERVRDMNANGVLGSMCFPSFPQFCGQLFARTAEHDGELALALLRAYNDWHVESWCGAYPGRFIPLALPVMWDPQLAADEVRRMADVGCHAMTFSENPEKLGHPSFHSDYWDPLWRACSDVGTVLCLHIGSSSQLVITSAEAPINVMITLQPMNIVQAAADLLWSRVLREFPELRFALSEGGIGWIPYFLERVDYVFEHHRAWTGADFGGRRPSDVFRERIICCFIDDAAGLESRHHVGIEQICWECDYPHSDSTWPGSPERLAAALNAASVPAADVAKITHENAMRLFSYDPFAHRPKERCTVGALRAEAADVDVSDRPQTGAQPRSPDEPPITVLTIAAAAAAAGSR